MWFQVISTLSNQWQWIHVISTLKSERVDPCNFTSDVGLPVLRTTVPLPPWNWRTLCAAEWVLVVTRVDEMISFQHGGFCSRKTRWTIRISPLSDCPSASRSPWPSGDAAMAVVSSLAASVSPPWLKNATWVSCVATPTVFVSLAMFC